MEKNMYGIQPQSLTTQELIRFAEDMVHKPEGLPKNWQMEILSRLAGYPIMERPATTDARQLELF
jgi:hypothetical protein